MTRSRPPHARAVLRVLTAALAVAAAGLASASSHREAPFVTTAPKVDATDFYLFRSYETGRENFVTLLADYLPLQDAYGGPNYFKLDPNALYEIHIDNNGDAKEDLTFQFRFQNTLKDVKVPVGDKMVSIPLTQAGAVANVKDANLNVAETYTVTLVRGDRRTGTRAAVVNASGGASTFDKPVDNIGVKTIADYAAYAAKHIYAVNIPGCSVPGKVFVGQRKDPFAVNLGTIFDLVNAPAAFITNPANKNAAPNTIDDKNVTTLALEVHKDCLTAGSDPVIGGWTTASLRQGQLLSGAPKAGHQTTSLNVGPWVQVSRLGMPLVNEVVIGLKDKDRFNGSKPKDDAQFLDYVTNPTLPVLLGAVLANDGAALAPTNLPRTDLATVFLTGIAGVNKPASVTPAEMLRLNTAIAPVPRAQQNRLGVAGEVLRVGGPQNLAMAVDLAGYPNGRRPNDDVVDISLVAVLGGLCVINGDGNALGLNGVPGVAALTSACKPSSVPLGATAAAVHDAVDQAVVPLLAGFPYLATPTGGTH